MTQEYQPISTAPKDGTVIWASNEVLLDEEYPWEPWLKVKWALFQSPFVDCYDVEEMWVIVFDPVYPDKEPGTDYMIPDYWKPL